MSTWTMIGNVPNDLNVPSIPLVAALLKPKTVMIDALPMIMPSIVRIERVRLRHSDASASADTPECGS